MLGTLLFVEPQLRTHPGIFGSGSGFLPGAGDRTRADVSSFAPPAGAYFDQAVRADTLGDKTESKVGRHLAQAEKLDGKGETASAVDQLNNASRVLGDSDLKDAIDDLAASLN